MEKLLNADVQKQLKQVFEELVNPVTMVLFTEDDCESCEPTLSLLTEIAELSDKLNLRVYDINSDEAKKYDIEMAPSFVLLDHNDEYHRVKFNGIPAGHEINSFISENPCSSNNII